MNPNPQLQDLLNQASELIKVQSHDDQELIASISKMDNKAEFLDNLKLEIPGLAQKGDTKQIGIYLAVLEYFKANPDTRKILHYFAQSESERGKKVIKVATKDELRGILENIAQAFKLANLMDTIIK